MNKLQRVGAMAMVAGLAVSGCAQTFDTTTLGVPATMAAPAGEVATGQAFKVTSHTVHAFWGLVPMKQAQLDRALAAQLVGGKEVAQLKIRTRARWKDLLVTAITLGVVAPRTVIYEGIIVGR